MLMKRIAGTAALGMVSLLGFAPMQSPAQAGYIVTLQEVGSDVVATGNGTIKVPELNFAGDFINQPVLNPSEGIILPLSSPYGNRRGMGLSLMVETGDGIMDRAFESVEIGDGAIGQIMLLEVAPASLDVIQLGGVFGQPFEGEPGALGERLCGQLAAVDRSIVEHRDQWPGAFGGAVSGAELIEQVDKVGGALGRAGMHEKAATYRIKGAEHRPLFALAGRFDPQIGAAPGPAARQIGMRERFRFIEE